MNKIISLKNFITAAENGDLDEIKYLIKNGVGIGEKTIDGSHAKTIEVSRALSALRSAAFNGHLNVVKFFKSRGIYEKEALEWAAINGHFEVVKFLANTENSLYNIASTLSHAIWKNSEISEIDVNIKILEVLFKKFIKLLKNQKEKNHE